MPRFFFHVHNSFGVALDDEGQEVDDLAAARSIAIDAARTILGEELRKGRMDLRGRIHIVDEAGEVRATVDYQDAVELHCA